MNMKTVTKWAVPVALLAVATASFAGTGGTEFDELQTLLEGWTEGVLGRILAIGALIVGIAFGLVRQSIIAAVIGIGMAVVLSYGPTVIGNIVSATAQFASVAQILLLSNGLM